MCYANSMDKDDARNAELLGRVFRYPNLGITEMIVDVSKDVITSLHPNGSAGDQPWEFFFLLYKDQEDVC